MVFCQSPECVIGSQERGSNITQGPAERVGPLSSKKKKKGGGTYGSQSWLHTEEIQRLKEETTFRKIDSLFTADIGKEIIV